MVTEPYIGNRNQGRTSPLSHLSNYPPNSINLDEEASEEIII